MLEVIKTYPLATVISIKDNQPFITHLPLIYQEGKLIGHLDKNNPQAQLLKNGNLVTLIFSGPQCYISPSIYTTPQLPTWNYIKVHLTGIATEITNPETVKQSMVSMTEILEAPEHNYVLDKQDKKMEQFINYVVGFEIEIQSWEGKFKLSQDKKTEDFDNAHLELITQNKKSIEPFLNRLL
ncbi:FMN-binding negative transcriptional regulator [Bizionia arctica]|uniref:Transcriptional regulator n=1 Tax=Bizionia arctica TaxID=1495645 RepID=A0A917GEJ0_9FLAO|nr:FMN-binding negative transcriptional regulator [Bizionia arctica]GGG41962.1 transcriptional regulator [Bizionia arctica]